MISIPIDIIKLIFEYARFEDQTWVPIMDKCGRILLHFNKFSRYHEKLTTGCIALWEKNDYVRFERRLEVILFDGYDLNICDTFYTTIKCAILKVYPRHGFYMHIEFEYEGNVYRGTIDTHMGGLIIKPSKEEIYLEQALFGTLYDGWITINDDYLNSSLKIVKY